MWEMYISICLSITRRFGRGRTVNQEQVLPSRAINLHLLLHCILEQLNRNLHGYNDTLLDIRLDHLAKFATRPVLLLAQQVAGREVFETIVRDELLALCAFACARAAEHEDDGDVFVGPEGRRALCCAELFDCWHICVAGALVHLKQLFRSFESWSQ